MAWTYSGNPAASHKDYVRFEIQDTETIAPLLQDEEIEHAIAQEAGPEPDEHGLLSASARCAEVIGRYFSRRVDVVEGSLEQVFSKMAKEYRALAKELRVRAQGASAPFAGGQSRSAKRALRQDLDRVQPTFRRGQHQVHRVHGGNAGDFPGELGPEP